MASFLPQTPLLTQISQPHPVIANVLAVCSCTISLMRLCAKGIYLPSPMYPDFLSLLSLPQLETQQETFYKEYQDSHPPPKNALQEGREGKKGQLD